MATSETGKAASRRYYAEHKAEINAKAVAKRKAGTFAGLKYREYMKQWHRDNEMRIAPHRRARNASRRLAQQEATAGRPCPELCELCGERGTSRRLHFDHDHGTGEFRGWLCARCNRVLGVVHDSVELLDAMIVYLARSRRPKLVATRA